MDGGQLRRPALAILAPNVRHQHGGFIVFGMRINSIRIDDAMEERNSRGRLHESFLIRFHENDHISCFSDWVSTPSGQSVQWFSDILADGQRLPERYSVNGCMFRHAQLSILLFQPHGLGTFLRLSSKIRRFNTWTTVENDRATQPLSASGRRG